MGTFSIECGFPGCTIFVEGDDYATAALRAGSLGWVLASDLPNGFMFPVDSPIMRLPLCQRHAHHVRSVIPGVNGIGATPPEFRQALSDMYARAMARLGVFTP